MFAQLRTPEKSSSVPNINELDTQNISIRPKKKRQMNTDDCECELRMDIFKEEMKNDIKDILQKFTEQQDKQNSTLLSALKDLQVTNASLQNTITFVTEQNAELKNKLDALQSDAKKDKEYILLLEEKMEDSQRNDRKTCIEIKNIPFSNTNATGISAPTDMVLSLAKYLSVTMEKRDIKDILRLKPKNERYTLIVELSTTFLKQEMLKNAKMFNIKNHSDKISAKHLGMKSFTDVPIFLSESLTPKAARLFFLARDAKKSKGFNYCWTNFGRVFLRKDEKSPIIHIKKEEQIQNIFNTWLPISETKDFVITV